MANYIEQASRIKLMLEEDRAYKQRDRQYSREQRKLSKLVTLELSDSDNNASEYKTFEQSMKEQGVRRMD